MSPYHVTNLWQPMDGIRPEDNIRSQVPRIIMATRDYSCTPRTSLTDCDVIHSHVTQHRPCHCHVGEATDGATRTNDYNCYINTMCRECKQGRRNVPDVCKEGIYEPLNIDDSLPTVDKHIAISIAQASP
jgi:hypothetical protein